MELSCVLLSPVSRLYWDKGQAYCSVPIHLFFFKELY
jgi:hypothetical protein